MTDYRYVGCEDYRALFSAQLDGEATPAEQTALDAHLAGCAACRRWGDDAAVLTRRIRTGAAAAAVDVTDAVLAAAPGRARAWLVTGLRLLLAGIGTAQLVLGLSQVVVFARADNHAGHEMVNGASAGHLWHESAAWNVAVGAAFLWVAARRSRPSGVLPILAAFVAVLAVLSAGDIIAGRVEAVRLASHIFVVSGFLLVLALSRPSLNLGDPPAVRLGDGSGPVPAGSLAVAEPRLSPPPSQPAPSTVAPLRRPLPGYPAAQVRHRDAA